VKLTFTERAWDDYLSWANDRPTLRRIHRLIQETMREPFEGIGKPEPLKGQLSGYWSRRIDHEHRLVYKAQDDQLVIIAARHHYDGLWSHRRRGVARGEREWAWRSSIPSTRGHEISRFALTRLARSGSSASISAAKASSS
jgi:toxin YoeB